MLRRLLPALALVAPLTLGLGCPPKVFISIAPTTGSIITTSSFTVQVVLGPDAVPGTLTATLNGVALPLTGGPTTFTADLDAGPPLLDQNELVVFAQATNGTGSRQNRSFVYGPPKARARQITSARDLITRAARPQPDRRLADRERRGALRRSRTSPQRDLHSVGQFGGNLIDAELVGAAGPGQLLRGAAGAQHRDRDQRADRRDRERRAGRHGRDRAHLRPRRPPRLRQPLVELIELGLGLPIPRSRGRPRLRRRGLHRVPPRAREALRGDGDHVFNNDPDPCAQLHVGDYINGTGELEQFIRAGAAPMGLGEPLVHARATRGAQLLRLRRSARASTTASCPSCSRTAAAPARARSRPRACLHAPQPDSSSSCSAATRRRASRCRAAAASPSRATSASATAAARTPSAIEAEVEGGRHGPARGLRHGRRRAGAGRARRRRPARELSRSGTAHPDPALALRDGRVRLLRQRRSAAGTYGVAASREGARTRAAARPPSTPRPPCTAGGTCRPELRAPGDGPRPRRGHRRERRPRAGARQRRRGLPVHEPVRRSLRQLRSDTRPDVRRHRAGGERHADRHVLRPDGPAPTGATRPRVHRRHGHRRVRARAGRATRSSSRAATEYSRRPSSRSPSRRARPRRCRADRARARHDRLHLVGLPRPRHRQPGLARVATDARRDPSPARASTTSIMTDHDAHTDLDADDRRARASRPSCTSTIGEEITTFDYGHFNAYPQARSIATARLGRLDGLGRRGARRARTSRRLRALQR